MLRAVETDLIGLAAPGEVLRVLNNRVALAAAHALAVVDKTLQADTLRDRG